MTPIGVRDWHYRQCIRYFELVAKQQRSMASHLALSSMRRDYNLALMHLDFSLAMEECTGRISKPYRADINAARAKADARIEAQKRIVEDAERAAQSARVARRVTA